MVYSSYTKQQILYSLFRSYVKILTLLLCYQMPSLIASASKIRMSHLPPTKSNSALFALRISESKWPKRL